MKLITKIIKAPLPGKVVQSFNEQSGKDWSFNIAGIQFAGHSDGLPKYFPNYITFENLHGTPNGAVMIDTSPVPEVSSSVLLGLGLLALFIIKRWA